MSALVEIVDNDAIEIGELYERSRTDLIGSVRSAIECGQRLTEKKAFLVHGAWLPWLETNAGVLGFETRRTSSRLMKLAAEANGTLASHLDEGAIKRTRTCVLFLPPTPKNSPTFLINRFPAGANN